MAVIFLGVQHTAVFQLNWYFQVIMMVVSLRSPAGGLIKITIDNLIHKADIGQIDNSKHILDRGLMHGISSTPYGLKHYL